jgi:hypothetical protein
MSYCACIGKLKKKKKTGSFVTSNIKNTLFSNGGEFRFVFVSAGKGKDEAE